MNKVEFKYAYRTARVLYAGMKGNPKTFSGAGDLRGRFKDAMVPLFGGKLADLFSTCLANRASDLSDRVKSFRRSVKSNRIRVVSRAA